MPSSNPLQANAFFWISHYLQIKHLFGFILLGSLFALSACQQKNQQTAGASPQSGPMPVKVMTPIQREVVEWDEYTGRFQAAERVEVRARVSGYLTQVHFKDGEYVEKGQLLFEIDSRPFQIAYDRVKAQFDLANNEFKRFSQLRASKSVSLEDYDVKLQEMRVAKANLEEAELNLEFTKVKAPFAGKTSRNYVDVGNLIAGGTSNTTLLTTIVSLDPIEFYFEGSESDVLKYTRLINSGNRDSTNDSAWPVSVKLQDEQSFIHKGTINFVDNELDMDTATKQVRAVFDNKAAILQPGLFGRLRIMMTAPFKALLVPDKIIGTEQTRKYVYVIGDKSKAVRKYLTLGGLQEDGMRIIKKGLDKNDQVLTGNLQVVHPGLSVKPVKAPPQTPNTQTPNTQTPNTPATKKEA